MSVDSRGQLDEVQNEGRKDDEGKLRYDLIPTGPLEKLAEVYTIGSKKYSDRNWEKGLNWGRVFGALCRHAFAWWSGEKLDPNDGQHHLASVAWCAFALMEYENTRPELDDRHAVPKHTLDEIKGHFFHLHTVGGHRS